MVLNILGLAISKSYVIGMRFTDIQNIASSMTCDILIYRILPHNQRLYCDILLFIIWTN
jgi:hypothetical protein